MHTKNPAPFVKPRLFLSTLYSVHMASCSYSCVQEYKFYPIYFGMCHCISMHNQYIQGVSKKQWVVCVHCTGVFSLKYFKEILDFWDPTRPYYRCSLRLPLIPVIFVKIFLYRHTYTHTHRRQLYKYRFKYYLGLISKYY
jgi:hypothetical protein